MNRRLCAQLWEAYPGQWERIGKMAILGYNQVHMANLCVAFSQSVNGAKWNRQAQMLLEQNL